MKYAEAEKKLKEAGNMIKVKAFIERGFFFKLLFKSVIVSGVIAYYGY